MKGRYYSYATTGFQCEGGNKIYEKLSTTTEAACGELCFNKHADFFSHATTSSSEYCYCWTGTCSSAPTSAVADVTVYKIEQLCYWTTPDTVLTDSGCLNSADLNTGLTAGVTFNTNWNV
jgi:hypothetical protein